MKLRKIFLLLMLTLLFLGLSYATEVSNDTTNTVDTGIADINDEVVQSSNMPIKEVEDIDEKNTKEISKQYNGTVKTESSITYEINDFDTLHSALMCDTYGTVTLNINSDITLASNTSINDVINKLTINGNGKTIDGDNQYQFLDIGPDLAEININNIKLTNCNAERGGAIYNYYGTLTIINSILNNNNAERGGAICNEYGTLTIINSILNNNNAEHGGAIYNYFATLTIINSTLNNNTADYGGAISSYGTFTLKNSTLNNNNGKYYGGAIFSHETSTIINSTLNNNNAGYRGGAIENSYGILTIINSTIDNNTAGYRGGAISIYGTLTIINTTIDNNNAEYGGAIYNEDGTLTIINSTLNNNNAEYGGAIYNKKTINITNSTLNDNYASSDGSAIYNYEGTAKLTDTIINNTICEEVGLYNLKGTITIYEYPTWIKLAYIGTVEYGSTVNVVARLFCNETTPLKYKWVNVTVNGNVYKVKSDGAGYIRLNYTVNSYDDQRVTVKYGGSKLYPASYIATTFDVKQPTWIKIASMNNVNHGSTVKVVARLFCNGTTPFKYKKVYVTVNDMVYSVKSDGAGYIRLNYTVKNFNDQKIRIKYAGDNIYQASTNSTVFKVKQPTLIKHAYVGTVEQGSTVKLVGRLLINGTTAVKYVKVKVTVNDNVYTLKTDGAGYYRLNYTATTPGKITFTSCFAGNSLYLASTKSTKFTVVKS